MVNEEQVDTITLVLKFTMLFDFRFLQNFSRNGILISGAWEDWWNERSKPGFENGKFFLASSKGIILERIVDRSIIFVVRKIQIVLCL